MTEKSMTLSNQSPLSDQEVKLSLTTLETEMIDQRIAIRQCVNKLNTLRDHLEKMSGEDLKKDP